MLKLKTYCWNHCSKIIFKCVNSTVGSIFNEKIDKKWNLWVHKQCTNALFTGKSQHLRLLFMHFAWTVTAFLQKRVKKKKKKNAKHKRWNADVLSKLSLSLRLFVFEPFTSLNVSKFQPLLFFHLVQHDVTNIWTLKVLSSFNKYIQIFLKKKNLIPPLFFNFFFYCNCDGIKSN